MFKASWEGCNSKQTDNKAQLIEHNNSENVIDPINTTHSCCIGHLQLQLFANNNLASRLLWYLL